MTRHLTRRNVSSVMSHFNLRSRLSTVDIKQITKYDTFQRGNAKASILKSHLKIASDLD